MTMIRDVLVTGIGIICPVGRGAGSAFRALAAGQSGIAAVPESLRAVLPVEVAGFAPDPDPALYLTRQEVPHVDRYIVLGLAAAEDALEDAGLTIGTDSDPWRTAVVVSSGAGGLAAYESQALAYRERGRFGVSPQLLPGMLPNMASARIAIRHGIHGHSSATTTACAAGAHSIADGYRLIADGDADVVLAGGVDAALTPTVASAFVNARALADAGADPLRASRPFDRGRTGFVLAEGGAVLVLEDARHAAARGVSGYAALVGVGSTSDAHHVSAPMPDGRGATEAMIRAINRARVRPADIDYVNAHGTATKLGDVAEARAINQTFGASRPRVSSVKGAIGHMLGGSGAAEAAFTAMTLATGIIPPTLNLAEPDEACDLHHVRDAADIQPVRYALSNTFAFGGHNVSLAFRKIEAARVPA
jgi:3-oxoacyl-[acyl-carrier-protein] synthase II